MTLNVEKCIFAVQEVKFLRHIIIAKGVSPDPEKIHAITNLQPPQSSTEVRSFLGMVEYSAKFILRVSNLLGSLYELLKQKSKFEWKK